MGTAVDGPPAAGDRTHAERTTALTAAARRTVERDRVMMGSRELNLGGMTAGVGHGIVAGAASS
jgi:hypothetical protein